MRIVLNGTRKDFKTVKEPRDRDRLNNYDTRAGNRVGEKRPADGSSSEAFNVSNDICMSHSSHINNSAYPNQLYLASNSHIGQIQI